MWILNQVPNVDRYETCQHLILMLSVTYKFAHIDCEQESIGLVTLLTHSMKCKVVSHVCYS